MKKKNKFPSAETIVEEAYSILPKADLNSLHIATFKIMMKHRQEYYKEKVKDFLNRKSVSNLLSVEVKNVALRERGVRGLSFDGDSMIGFFNDAKEFTKDTIKIIDKHCRKTGGYCYVPPEILKEILSKHNAKRFKSNDEFVSDMNRFVKSGTI